MNPVEQDIFESSAKSIAIETASVTCDAPVPTKPSRSIQKNNENVTWKYTTANNTSQASKKEVRLYKQNYRNISFKEARCETEYRSDFFVTERKQQQIKQSSLFRNYQTSHQVYRKKYEFGTSWIGKQHYFASIFANSDILNNKKIKYPLEQSQPYEDRTSHMMPCTFDSDFQSGNLYAAYKVGKCEYDLVLQNDFNTKGNTQWFYFRIKNPPKNKNIKLNIVNMQKTDSLFNYGMKPCIFSLCEWNKCGKGWVKGGSHIKYFRNDNTVQNENKCYYTLSFTISTSYEYDVIRIAQNYPYTTLDLEKYLDGLSRVKCKRELLERQAVATTVGKNNIECVTIKQHSRELNKNKNSKPVIIFMARQHPGETQSSYICQGVIDFLMSNSRESQFLRKNYEIKIIPMVNPDGVVVGNYRTNLYGYDLNRKWQGGKTKVPMESSLIKKFLIQTLVNRRVAFVIDLHGHSRKLFSFFYGNHSNQSSIQPRIFPYICSKVSPNYIKFQDCQFSIESTKRNTARVQLYLLFKSANIFTFETSFYGYVDKNGVQQHHTTQSYRELGSVLCRSIYAYERGKCESKMYLDSQELNLYLSSVNQLKSNSHFHRNSQQDSGSDSNPECYELVEAESQKLNANTKYNSNSRHRIAEMRRLASTQRKSQMFNKTPKQMKCLELAQVNSIFPKNIIALLPNSFIGKNGKGTADISTQTEDVCFENIKVQEEETICYKNSQSNLFNPFSSKVFTKNKTKAQNFSSVFEQKSKENTFKSTKNIPAKEETLGNVLFKTNGFRSFSQRRQEYQSLRKQKQRSENKSHSRTNSKLSVHPNKKQKATQTNLTINNHQEFKSDLRDTATSQQQKSQVFDRRFITVYNQLKNQRPKGRSSRFNTLGQLFTRLPRETSKSKK